MQIRPLTPEDGTAYQSLRLEALASHPTAYVTDLTEEAALGPDAFRERLAASEASITFGAWDGERLVGIASLIRPTKLRQRFRATIVGMYVVPPCRGQGVARKLLAACVEHARRQDGLEEVCLCITVGNDSARRVYESFGFQSEYVEPRYFKYQGQYYDLEWMRLPLVGSACRAEPERVHGVAEEPAPSAMQGSSRQEEPTADPAAGLAPPLSPGVLPRPGQ